MTVIGFNTTQSDFASYSFHNIRQSELNSGLLSFTAPMKFKNSHCFSLEMNFHCACLSVNVICTKLKRIIYLYISVQYCYFLFHFFFYTLIALFNGILCISGWTSVNSKVHSSSSVWLRSVVYFTVQCCTVLSCVLSLINCLFYLFNKFTQMTYLCKYIR